MEFMQRALDLAERVAGGLAPRPPVGAVIVAEDGKTIVGEGATQSSPGPHAEAVAIAKAQDAARNGTIYCTLEPHQHRSTTPPCSQAIIDAGIGTVVCPTVDPNPQVAGLGFKHLKSAGIKVVNDVDEVSQRRADELIEGFAKHINTGLPFVTVKWAMSLDGKIATRDRDSQWITGSAARAHAHSLRYRSDAVMTGIGTVIADNPRLTARDPKSGKRMCGRPYIRVVIDSDGRMPEDAALLEEEGEIIQAVARNTTRPLDTQDGNTARPLDTQGVNTHLPFDRQGGNAPLPLDDQGGIKGGLDTTHPHYNVIAFPNNRNASVDLAAVIQHLGERGCHNMLVEAGEKLTGELFDLKLVDKVVVYIATRKIIGGAEALTPVGGIGPATISESSRLCNARIERIGDDMAIIGYVDYA